MKEFLVTAPGLLGDLARYVYARLNTDEPAIALAASLSFMGALLSGRVESTTGIQPNIYAGIVAESGIGKSQAQSVLKELALLAGLESPHDFLMGKPASDSGLLSALNRSPRQLLIWDEFGIALSALSSSKATHEALILSQIMELYSSAGKPLKGKEYASKERVDIQGGAYLSILGASTPNRFFAALNQDFIEDGFLPRWLLFFQSEKFSEKKPEYPSTVLLVEKIRAVQAWERPEGNLASVGTETTKLEINASKALGGLWSVDLKNQREGATSSAERVFLSRLNEQATKILLCCCDTGVFDADEALWVRSLAEEIMRGILKKCEKNIFANSKIRDYNKLRDRFAALLQPGQAIQKADLCKRTQHWCAAQERNQVIEALLDAGDWQSEISSNPQYPNRKTTVYSCSKK